MKRWHLKAHCRVATSKLFSQRWCYDEVTPPTKFAAATRLNPHRHVFSELLPASPPRSSSSVPSFPSDAPAPHRTRLILKDGSYQVVMSYRVVGNVVRYVSAERGGAEGDPRIPRRLRSSPAAGRPLGFTAPPDADQAPVLSLQELPQRGGRTRASLTPEVVPDLPPPRGRQRPYALDYFHGTPELVPLAQSPGDLNRNTAHNLVRATINPLSQRPSDPAAQG